MLATVAGLLLGGLLRLPALYCGFTSDDYPQLATLHGAFLLKRPAWDLFWFGPRTEAELQQLVDFGFDPWWTAAGHRLAMFRPLSSLLIAFDDAWFGHNAVLWHVHSFAWWALLVCAVGLLFVRLLPGPIAACATMLYALDGAHNTPLCWLANRGTLVSASFGVLALTLHLRFRLDRFRVGLWLSAGCWALSLAAGEYALSMLAYLVAYEWLGARDAPTARARALVPAAGLLVIYAGVRTLLGYGVAESSLYVSPDDSLRFLSQAATHVPVLAAELLLSVPALWWQGGPPQRNLLLQSELFTPAGWHRLPDWQSLHIALGALALLAGLGGLRWLRRSMADEAHTLRWLLTGSLLGLFVAASATPSARLLAAPALGVAALLAALMVRGLSSRGPRGTVTGIGAALGAGIVLVHAVGAAHAAYADTESLRERFQRSERAVLNAALPHAIEGVDVVVVSASDYATGANLPWVRLDHGLPLPRSYRLLSGARQAHEIKRVDAHSIELTILSNDVRGAFAGSPYRADGDALHAGQKFSLRGMRIEVLSVQDGNPQRLRFQFDRALEDPTLYFLFAYPDGLRRLTLPKVGERALLPMAALP